MLLVMCRKTQSKITVKIILIVCIHHLVTILLCSVTQNVSEPFTPKISASDQKEIVLSCLAVHCMRQVDCSHYSRQEGLSHVHKHLIGIFLFQSSVCKQEIDNKFH